MIMKKISLKTSTLVSILVSLLFYGCSIKQNNISVVEIEHGDISIKFNNKLYSQINTTNTLIMNDFSPTEYVEVGEHSVTDFIYMSHSSKNIDDLIGKGTVYSIVGASAEELVKTVQISLYDEFPSLILFKVSYLNNSTNDIRITKWVNNHYKIAKKDESSADFWSYQAASYTTRHDWIRPVHSGFSQENYMGMNASDYGGGTAISDVWRQDIGLAVGHIEITPKLISLPVKYPRETNEVNVGVHYERVSLLKQNQSTETFTTFANVHQGDYYQTLITYRNIMAKQGLTAPTFPDSTYETIWCAWGYERDFNVEEILATLPKVKELGLEWAVLDDGWQTAEGDWYLNKEKFPNGDSDMKSFVHKINQAGLKAKLWWAPLAVDPGTDLIRDHEDMLLLDKSGKPVDITWWDSYYLCPAYEKTIEHSNKLINTMMTKWGYSGLKIDGHHLNGVPACYNKKHNHAYPEESIEKLQDYWKSVYETAQAIDKESVIEICPCGDSYAFHNIPYMNQAVSSDPESSWQLRFKGKTLKGLMGDSAPYYGDHVELSDKASDFASSVGVGAVVGTKFTWPKDSHPQNGFTLTKDKEKKWAKWIDIYKDKMLPKGIYKGELYDIGFDKPETHAIEKDGRMYYAFYAEYWSGKLELRGLENKQYKLVNYVDNIDLGFVNSNAPFLDTVFEGYLLIEAIPFE